MKASITSIEALGNECVKITAVLYWRGFPRPKYETNETDDEYAARVQPIAKELDSYNNLHIGWATLTQEIETTTIPKIDEYDA